MGRRRLFSAHRTDACFRTAVGRGWETAQRGALQRDRGYRARRRESSDARIGRQGAPASSLSGKAGGVAGSRRWSHRAAPRRGRTEPLPGPREAGSPRVSATLLRGASPRCSGPRADAAFLCFSPDVGWGVASALQGSAASASPAAAPRGSRHEATIPAVPGALHTGAAQCGRWGPGGASREGLWRVRVPHRWGLWRLRFCSRLFSSPCQNCLRRRTTSWESREGPWGICWAEWRLKMWISPLRLHPKRWRRCSRLLGFGWSITKEKNTEPSRPGLVRGRAVGFLLQSVAGGEADSMPPAFSGPAFLCLHVPLLLACRHLPADGLCGNELCSEASVRFSVSSMWKHSVCLHTVCAQAAYMQTNVGQENR